MMKKHSIFTCFSFKRLFQFSGPLGLAQLRNFTHKLTAQQKQIQKLCRNLAQQDLKPIASKLDSNALFPSNEISKLGSLGIMSLCVSPKYGGAGLDSISLSVAVEELARCCSGTGAIVAIHNFLYVNLLNRLGTEKQKEIYLTPFTKGTLGCFALSEPNAGSDVANIETLAHKDGDFWILNGVKSWVTSAHNGKAIILFANIDKSRKHRGLTAFITNIDTPGLFLGPKDDLMGVRALSTCNVHLENVRIHKDFVIGNVGEGFKIAMTQLDQARIGIASQSIGISQAALDCAVNYANQRQAFGRPLSQLASVQSRIAEMKVRLEGARLLTRKAALEIDSGKRSTIHSSIAKVAASTCAAFATSNCVQIFGAMGYVKGLPAERLYRDARATQIYGGVTDVQKMVIAQQVINEYQNTSKGINID